VAVVRNLRHIVPTIKLFKANVNPVASALTYTDDASCPGSVFRSLDDNKLLYSSVF
jgi:hypothetical protein